MSAPPAAKPRGRQTVRDMVLSLGVILLVVAVWVAVVWRPRDAYEPLVDPAPAVAMFARAAPFTVLAPEGLRPGWRTSSTRYDVPGGSAAGTVQTHLGMIDPAGEYVGLEQSNAGPAVFAREQSLGGRPQGTIELDGVTWERWDGGERDYRALVRAVPAPTDGDASTVVINGRATWESMAELATSLVPQPRQSAAPTPAGPPSGAASAAAG